MLSFLCESFQKTMKTRRIKVHMSKHSESSALAIKCAEFSKLSIRYEAKFNCKPVFE